MADRARLEREITHELMQNDDKLSLVALTYKMMEAHLDSAGPGVLKKLGDCSMEEFLGATEVGRALMAATQWDEKRMQGLKTHISWEDFRRKAHMLSKSIFENFKLLGNILDRHEATIHRRWLKKSNKLRLAIICEAWGVRWLRHIALILKLWSSRTTLSAFLGQNIAIITCCLTSTRKICANLAHCFF